MNNPWEEISLVDYENHMRLPKGKALVRLDYQIRKQDSSLIA